VIGRIVRALDERTGQASFVRKALRYVFPDHWSFLLGEIALYSFLVLVATGVYLTLFFDPSLAPTTYHGPYEPLRGEQMSQAYASALHLSFEVKAGLLMRQTHHWAANVFIVAIVLHAMRVFFTGAFRKPRDLTYLIGVTMLALALLEGYLGYSLLDDLLSGMGLAIGYAVVLSIPGIGANIANGIWGGEYPGAPDFLSRLYIVHVLLLPIAIGALLGLHLLLVALAKHSQFPGGRRTEHNVVGTPLWPGYALRSLGLACLVVAVLFGLGGLVQINPIWLWGPYEPWLSTNGAQPDWYLGWLIGALRLMPGWEPAVGDYTLAGNPFFGGVLFPGAVFGFLYLWPWLERRFTGDRERHHLLDRPRDAPVRTAAGAALVALVLVVLVSGAADRFAVETWTSYEAAIWVLRALVFVLPAGAFIVALAVCRSLASGDRADRRDPRYASPSPP
jgi:ubiquinol-cytochrome c reductase cytochrome b subunit